MGQCYCYNPRGDSGVSNSAKGGAVDLIEYVMNTQEKNSFYNNNFESLTPQHSLIPLRKINANLGK